ncbi:hypothetical protein FJ250_11120, partial [bacterium]|nr:hypothetical protein [bacterium]
MKILSQQADRSRGTLPRVPAAALFCLGLLLAAGAARAEPVGQSLPAPVPGTTAAVFHASAAARDQTPPSLCLQAPLRPDGPPPPGWESDPTRTPVFSRVQGRPAVFLPIADG